MKSIEGRGFISNGNLDFFSQFFSPHIIPQLSSSLREDIRDCVVQLMRAFI